MCCPMKRYDSTNKSKQWITSEVRDASIKLKNLYWLHRILETRDSLRQYRTFKLTYRVLINNAKRKFNDKILSNSTNINRSVWKIVNGETGRKKNTMNKITLSMGEDECSEPGKVANAFGEYFSKVAARSLEEHYGGSLSRSCTSSKMRNENFFFLPVMGNEILSTIKGLKNKKCTGTDYMTARILKHVAALVSEHLAHLINLSIASGRFPSVLKVATVIPVHKKNDPNIISNYRPVSILSVFSKVIEKIVFDRVNNYLNKYKIISNNQHGFRAGRSTQTAAVSLVGYVHECLDAGLHVAGFFFDQSRAFDCLMFGFILDKLYNLGFRGIFHDWLGSFIGGRSVVVRVQNGLSGNYGSTLGVPQGSVLGPLLFLLFINDLPEQVKAERIIIFADDTSFAISAPSHEELSSRCKVLLTDYIEWCRKNSLLLNLDKTECIYFSTNSLHRDVLSFVYDDVILTSKPHTRFLGIYVDSRLRWCDHVDQLCRRLNSAYYAIYRIKKSLPVDTLLSVYYGLFYAHMDYNIILWGNSVDVGRVFLSQKRVVRLMFNLGPRESCKKSFVDKNMLTAPSLYIFRCLLYIRENECSLPRLADSHRYLTRYGDLMALPKHRSSRFESSPLYQGRKLYNHLPPEVRSLPYPLFKIKIRKQLLRKGYYSVGEFLGDRFDI
ncbi:hypothetical protein WA026_016945 [Henosepilachna vigintioctopunctata]|uniref:Reverse transcriptase domain-containing protein n=1 Tax=Henosepilachna vigintioctopunctata TaxID=420089 RepID=A0AAW1U0A4_9CUCU